MLLRYFPNEIRKLGAEAFGVSTTSLLCELTDELISPLSCMFTAALKHSEEADA